VNSYKLNDKQQDQDFLSGKTVTGPAVFLSAEFTDDIVKRDERIVVVLSNGKKYMGKVLSFTFDSKDGMVKGLLEIVKA
jgi:hypothetical protein